MSSFFSSIHKFLHSQLHSQYLLCNSLSLHLYCSLAAYCITNLLCVWSINSSSIPTSLPSWEKAPGWLRRKQSGQVITGSLPPTYVHQCLFQHNIPYNTLAELNKQNITPTTLTSLSCRFVSGLPSTHQPEKLVLFQNSILQVGKSMLSNNPTEGPRLPCSSLLNTKEESELSHWVGHLY